MAKTTTKSTTRRRGRTTPTEAQSAAAWEGPAHARAALVPVDDLIIDPDNPNDHDERSIEAIRRSLEEYGQQKPLVYLPESRVVAAGNGTLAAAQALGWSHVWAVPTNLEGVAVDGFRIADNETARLAIANAERTAALLQAIRDHPEGNLEATGYDDARLAELLQRIAARNDPTGGAREDEPPDPPEKAAARLGDVWALGLHTLVVGSAEDEDSYRGVRADLVVTDPPYGVDYVGGNHALPPERRGGKTLHNDVDDGGRLWGVVVRRLLQATRSGAGWYVAAAPGPLLHGFLAPMVGADVLRQVLVWVKDSHVMGRSDFHYRHEPILYGWTPGGQHVWYGGRTQDSVWEVPRPRRSQDHPTTKPVVLFARAIQLSSKAGDLVLDPFCGSGTTVVACEQLDRRCHAIELDPRYADVIIRRWQDVSGGQATLDGDGRTFAEVAAERGQP